MGAKYQKNSLFIDTKKAGQIRVRIIGNVVKYNMHYAKTKNENTVVVRCPGEDTCPICEANLEESKKSRYLYPVLDRSTGSGKILSLNHSAAKQLDHFANISPYQNLMTFDITLKKCTKGNKHNLSIIPHVPSIMTPEDIQKANEFFKSNDLNQYAKPHSRDEILKMLED